MGSYVTNIAYRQEIDELNLLYGPYLEYAKLLLWLNSFATIFIANNITEYLLNTTYFRKLS